MERRYNVGGLSYLSNCLLSKEEELRKEVQNFIYCGSRLLSLIKELGKIRVTAESDMKKLCDRVCDPAETEVSNINPSLSAVDNPNNSSVDPPVEDNTSFGWVSEYGLDASALLLGSVIEIVK